MAAGDHLASRYSSEVRALVRTIRGRKSGPCGEGQRGGREPTLIYSALRCNSEACLLLIPTFISLTQPPTTDGRAFASGSDGKILPCRLPKYPLLVLCTTSSMGSNRADNASPGILFEETATS